jgi:hypothetical protein
MTVLATAKATAATIAFKLFIGFSKSNLFFSNAIKRFDFAKMKKWKKKWKKKTFFSPKVNL